MTISWELRDVKPLATYETFTKDVGLIMRAVFRPDNRNTPEHTRVCLCGLEVPDDDILSKHVLHLSRQEMDEHITLAEMMR